MTQVAEQSDNTNTVETTRFGCLTVDASKVIRFADGILGLTGSRRYALFEQDGAEQFWWLQSLDEPSLALVVTEGSWMDPRLERSAIPHEARRRLRLDQADGLPGDPYTVLVICNLVEGQLTANLQGPIFVNLNTMRAEQVVLDGRFPIRHPVLLGGVA